MGKAIGILESICRVAAGVAFTVLMGAVIIQVLGRSVFASSPVWTEELTRFALLFTAAFGAGLSYRSGDLVNVDLICDALPGRWPWLLRLISAGLTAMLCLVLLKPAWLYTSIGVLQTSPALGWRMDFIHVSILVMLSLLGLFATLRFIRMLVEASQGVFDLPRAERS